jgi:hypothetical protein
MTDTPYGGLLWTRDARRRDLYLIKHNAHRRQTTMFPEGFEPAIPASEGPQIHALDRVATWIGPSTYSCTI